jgi:diacylglycerol kinase family enzyme
VAVIVLLNAASGTGSAADAARTIERLFGEAGRDVRVELVESGQRLRVLASEAARGHPEAVVAGGGDGTISTVAEALAGTDIPLGVLPLGTLNHFAKDLGIPLDLEQAISVILAGRITKVDVGEVSGHIFLNNSSIGVYPRLLRLRERYRERGRSKWIAAFWAMLAVLRRHSFMAVRIVADGETIVRRTPFVFVGNNAYRMEGLSAGSRDSLTDGRLAVYVMNATGRRSLLWLAWSVLIGRARQIQELEMLSVLEAQVETRRPKLQVALDGEVVEERDPLAYRVRPAALPVFTPPA